jgi:hypothetical protein
MYCSFRVLVLNQTGNLISNISNATAIIVIQNCNSIQKHPSGAVKNVTAAIFLSSKFMKVIELYRISVFSSFDLILSQHHFPFLGFRKEFKLIFPCLDCIY